MTTVHSDRSLLGQPSLPAILAGLSLMAVAVAIGAYERLADSTFDPRAAAIVLCSAALLASIALLATRRPAFSVLATCLAVCAATGISIVKFRYLESTLHAYDLLYYARRFEEAAFFARFYPGLAALGTLAAALCVATLAFVFRSETARVRRSTASACIAAALILCVAAFAWRGERGKFYHFRDSHHASALFVSLPETVSALWRGGLLEAAKDEQPEAPVAPAAGELPAAGVRPTIVVILHEAVMPLDLYPIVRGGAAPRDLFLSGDGHARRLQVETFGGGTWLSEYGLLTGISTYYFGNMRNFIAQFMAGKIRTGLAYELKRHGYKSVALYPSSGSFMETRAFYGSLGFDTVLDYREMAAPTQNERDSFYYEKALEQMERGDRDAPGQPLFIFLWTMATHAPYTHRIFPELSGHDGAQGRNPEWTEYLRRLSIAEADFRAFQEQVSARTRRPVLFLGFGDHQPVIARQLLPTDPVKTQNDVPEAGAPGYTTFYRVNTVRFDADYSALPAALDIPYLPVVLMKAARLPMSESFGRRERLMEACEGRYSSCPRQDEVLRFHAWLLQWSLVLR